MSAYKPSHLVASITLVFSLIFFASTVKAYRPSEQTLTIGDYDHYEYTHAPYFYGRLDAAGYSDVIYWGYEPNHHPYDYHEVLSGEWGSFAIYYDGIATEPNSMFLTNQFLYPDWEPQNNFYSFGASAWNNPNNPIDCCDTGQSVIKNGQVRVTVDYEVVDLGDGNFSPLAIRNAGGQIGFVKSFRYLFLQTYTIKNIKTSGNITGLELYGMLHSHGADDYGPVVHCSYTPAVYNDALANYTPYNPVHTVGNFCFDITQWNEPNDPNANPQSTPHQDWVGFGCTVKPDVYECNVYNSTDLGYYGKPGRPGVHWDIEERNLNDVNYCYGETAGALGWHLGNLANGQSKSITVAFMFGYGPIDYNQPILPPDCEITLTKTDDANGCVYPSSEGFDSEITYDVNYSIPCEINDIKIIDTLPPDATFVDATGDWDYNSVAGTVTWDLGNIDPCQNGCFTLTVRVNEDAPQGSPLTNTVKMYSGSTLIKTAAKQTLVCCMDNKVYVQ